MKRRMQIGYWVGVLGLVVGVSGCSRTPSANSATPPIPANWVIGSEDETETADEAGTGTPPGYTTRFTLQDEDEQAEAEAPPALGDTARELFGTQAESLESLPAPSAPAMAKDPWRLSAVLTDLSISASGWLGFLIQKGTPSVTTVWRRQYPAPTPIAAPAPNFAETEGGADLVLGPESTRADIERDLEPSVRALLSTGTIHGETNLRKNLLAAAEDFQNLTSLLSTVNPRGQWWVSRFRLDFAVDVAGNVTPAVTLGAEAKVRFEWHRLRAKAPAQAPAQVASFRGSPGLAENLVAFAGNLADDLSEIADGAAIGAKGFRAYGYRVGLGISAKGDVGVAKATGTLIGHLYFSRDVKKPVVNPKPAEASPPLLLVGDTNGRGVAKVDRRDFRRGLKKALRIGRFFSRRAQAFRGKWRIYELRTGFDLSFGGKTGIVKVASLASTEISFYNEGF